MGPFVVNPGKAAIAPAPARAPLSRPRILDAAVALIDADGLEAFTMRRLGAALGVEAMAIYKHLPNKAAVLDGVIDLLLAELNEHGPPPTDWRGALETLARRHRAIEQRHPGAYALLANMPGSAYLAARPAVEEILVALREGGFSATDASRALRIVVRYAIGFTLTRPATGTVADARDPLAPILSRLLDPSEEDVLFTQGLTALLDGLAPGPTRAR